MNAGINYECHKLDEDEERDRWNCSQTDLSFLYFPNLLQEDAVHMCIYNN